METPTPASATAPAADATTAVPASDAAIASGKTADYRDARRAERAGKPLAAVPIEPKVAPDAAGDPKLSRKERDQHDANERTRKAVDAATADLRAELDRLKAGAAAPRSDVPPDPAAPAPPEKKTPEYKRIMALAGAPKLADFDSVEEHAFAAAEFIDSVRTQERESTARNRASQDALFASEKAADDAFFDQLEQAKTADPEFVKKVAPQVLALTPVEWLPRDKEGRPLDAAGRPMTTGPLNVVASELRKSPVVRDLMLHFSQHPADLAKFAELPPAVAAIADPRTRLRAHVAHIVREFHRLEGRFTAGAAAVAAEPEPKTISDAPDPAPVLGTRPVETGDPLTKAVKRGDTRSYRELRRQERAAGIRR